MTETRQEHSIYEPSSQLLTSIYTTAPHTVAGIENQFMYEWKWNVCI